MHLTDWLPTLYRLGGGDVRDLGDIDGIDQLPVIRWTTIGCVDLWRIRSPNPSNGLWIFSYNHFSTARADVPNITFYNNQRRGGALEGRDPLRYCKLWESEPDHQCPKYMAKQHPRGNYKDVIKHCQRHNRPQGWFHITNLDQNSILESQLSINFKTSTKHQPLD